MIINDFVTNIKNFRLLNAAKVSILVMETKKNVVGLKFYRNFASYLLE